MLESIVGVGIVDKCLCSPNDAVYTVRSLKSSILDKDRESLLSSAATHPTAQLAAKIAAKTSWRLLWDRALDLGIKGTRHLQCIVHLLSQPIYTSPLSAHSVTCGWILPSPGFLMSAPQIILWLLIQIRYQNRIYWTSYPTLKTTNSSTFYFLNYSSTVCSVSLPSLYLNVHVHFLLFTCLLISSCIYLY